MARSREDQRIDRELQREGNGTDPFAAAMRATRMPMLITDPRQDDNPIVFVNEAFLRLTGYPREEVLGRNCRLLQGPETDPTAIERIRQAVAAPRPIEIEVVNYRKNGTTFWNRVLISPVFDGDELSYFFASQLDISAERTAVDRLTTDQHLLQAELRRRILDLAASEERLRFTLKAGGLGTWTLDLEAGRLMCSAICKENFGRNPADAFTYDDLQQAIVAEDLPHWRSTIERALATDGVFEVQYRVRTPAHELRWIEVSAQTSFSGEGRPIAMSGISRDITSRKQLEEHRAMLTNEMGHRIKNILANAQGIVRQSLRVAGAPAELQQTIEQRLEALAKAQDLLLAQKFGPVGFSTMVEECISHFSAYASRIRWSGSVELRVLPTVASALAMALHELATNAVKHGALSNDHGFVELWWDIRDAVFQLVWSEHSGPPVSPPSRRGFGSRLIVQGLAGALSGVVEVDYRESGLQVVIRAPVDRLTAA